MALTNLENRVKQDSAYPRTAEDVIRRDKDLDKVTIKASQIELEGYTTINDGFKIDKDGDMECNNATINNATINNATVNTIRSSNLACLEYTDNNTASSLKTSLYTGILELQNFHDINDSEAIVEPQVRLYWNATGDNTTLGASGLFTSGQVSSINGICQGSKEEYKKNFEKLENALDIVKDTDIYKYNLKDEKETDKKHIGFVIGENFNYRKEITSQKNDSAELYSMISVLWKAVQEQQEEIEELRKLVNK